MIKYYLFILFLISLLALSGCGSTDTKYVPLSKVESIQNKIETPVTTPSELEAQPENSKIQIFKIGETATDNQLKVTVNSVEYEKMLYFKSAYSSIPMEISEGNEFLIIDLTIENILSDKIQTPVLNLQTSVTDQDSYSYQLDTASVALDKVYDNKDILPGMKKRGKVAYSVPEDSTDLKFIFKFDVFQGKTAVFDIK